MAVGRDRGSYSGMHKQHRGHMQVLTDSIGQLVWTSPALPGAHHDMGPAREHGLIHAFSTANKTRVEELAPSWIRRTRDAPPVGVVGLVTTGIDLATLGRC
jgi:hypothetical protein